MRGKFFNRPVSWEIFKQRQVAANVEAEFLFADVLALAIYWRLLLL